MADLFAYKYAATYEVMFGELSGKTGHDFLIWKVKRRVGNRACKWVTIHGDTPGDWS